MFKSCISPSKIRHKDFLHSFVLRSSVTLRGPPLKGEVQSRYYYYYFSYVCHAQGTPPGF